MQRGGHGFDSRHLHMTPRVWFTISAVVLAAIFGAAGYRFFVKPFDPPAILAIAGEVPLSGERSAMCWPDASSKPRCETSQVESDGGETIEAEGSIRLVAAFPQAPTDGLVEILRGTQTVKLQQGFPNELEYSLTKGSYVLVVTAKYPDGSYVTYRFGFVVAAT